MSSLGWRTQFLLLSATWGSSFLFVKVLDGRWPALWVAFGRIALGALTLVVFTYLRGERLRFSRRVWLHLVVSAALLNAIPFSLFAFGEKHVSSVIAGLWNATTPLWVLGATVTVFGDERPGSRGSAGLAIGFIGVTLILGPWRGLGGGELTGQLACAGAAVCYGFGFPYTRRYLATRAAGPGSGAGAGAGARAGPRAGAGAGTTVALPAGQLLCATAMLALVVPFAGAPSTRLGLDGLGSLLALGILGSGVAYIWNYAILRAAGAAVASTVTYLVPVFSTALGVAVLGEPLSWNQPVGALVLLSGIALSQGRIGLR